MPVEVDERPLAELAAAVWRLHRKVQDGPLHRHVLGVGDALAALGVQIHEYDGLAYTAGLQLRVLAFQPTAGLEAERVLETVGPAVTLRGSLIRMGEVIVGIPEDAPGEDR
ncbi:hypothetical protein LO763_05695 [Glycomyces sp. A-F 0318]|uniref:hypothetical protein n=1 Tax=Glycomyces amatae TaxID=2881355 RepID=UPI001E5C6999|nr:hypothetical protein [Glycomyces amatae]MCD0443121.1 hypothetical protein [Glycomyces amatae]